MTRDVNTRLGYGVCAVCEILGAQHLWDYARDTRFADDARENGLLD